MKFVRGIFIVIMVFGLGVAQAQDDKKHDQTSEPPKGQKREVGKSHSSKNFTLEITKKTTKEEIEAIQQDLKRRHITLEFEKLTYVAGRLRAVKGTITFKDGMYSEFDTPRLRYVRIYREYNRAGRGGNIRSEVK